MRRPPTPTLFPYTSLFRSRARQHVALGGEEIRARGVERLTRDVGPRDGVRQAAIRVLHRCSALGQEKVFRRERPGRDRKSTRLNSSHGYISYAVFCLKKKK